MGPIKSPIGGEVDALAGDLHKVSEFLCNNPEIGYQEFRACKFLSRFMEERGFKAKRGLAEFKPHSRPGRHRERFQGTFSLVGTPTEGVCAMGFFYRHP